MPSPSSARRAALPDTIRGAAILSMIAYHACWDGFYLLGLPWGWFTSDAARFWQQSICWTFILLSGFCWPMGRHHLKRGLTVLGAGALLTIVTLLLVPENRVICGVLTFTGSAMLLMIPLDRLCRRIPPILGAAGSFIVFLALWTITLPSLSETAGLPLRMLAVWTGFPPADFFSTDYFSLLPWLFLFLAGYFLHRLCAPALERADPDILRCRPLCALGRWSLPVYMIHQPVVYGVLTLFAALMR